MTKFVDSLGLKRLVTKIAEAVGNGTWLPVRKGEGGGSVEEGNGEASGAYSHAEGESTTASGAYSHAQGSYNHNNPAFIDMVGVGSDPIKKNASVIYVKRDSGDYPDPSDPKKWLSILTWCRWLSRSSYYRGYEECAGGDSRP